MVLGGTAREEARRAARPCSNGSGWATASTTIPTSSRAVSSNASRSRAAFVKRPRIVWADEPTGNLDTKSAARCSISSTELHRGRHHADPRDPRRRARGARRSPDRVPRRSHRLRSRATDRGWPSGCCVVACRSRARCRSCTSSVAKPELRSLAFRNAVKRRGPDRVGRLGRRDLRPRSMTSAGVVGDSLRASVRRSAVTQLGPVDEEVLTDGDRVGPIGAGRRSDRSRASAR